MISRRVFVEALLVLPATLILPRSASMSPISNTTSHQKRWLFIWRDLSDLQQVDATIAMFSRAQADGYNGIVFGSNIAPVKASEFKHAAKQHGLGLIAMVMGGVRDPNYVEGFFAQDAHFVVNNSKAQHTPDNPTKVANGDFEDFRDNHFNGWQFQDSEGQTTFADHEIKHSGTTSLRMENVGNNPGQHCRIMQTIHLQPRRQYKITVWVKTQDLSTGIVPEVKLLTTKGDGGISYESFHCDVSQDWKQYNLVFNSLENTSALLYLGTWGGTTGKIWWDDLRVDEIALVNMLRRPGCPVTVRGDDGTIYTEGADYVHLVDPMLHPWVSFHEPPQLQLATNSRIKEGQSLWISYYHSVIVLEDRVNACLSEPRVFEDWSDEVKKVNALCQPDAFFMQHDELREMNQCASCRAKNMTAGELLAWNIHKATDIIRSIRPDASIWVWSDMFDPYHNAVEQYYLVRGSLKGSWKGLDKDVGIVNWNGGGLDKDCRFFASLGLKQILSGYYDSDTDGTKITAWENSVKHVPGVVGSMYTTWENNYVPMGVWARKAWGSEKS